MASSQKQKQRADFFTDLEKLDDLDSDEDADTKDVPDSSPFQVKMNYLPLLEDLKSKKQSRSTRRYEIKKEHLLKTTNSTSMSQTACINSELEMDVSLPVRESSTYMLTVPKKTRATVSARNTTARVTSARAGKKRLKSGIAQEDQIFLGTNFYFVPNNDYAGPRRRRIQKAIEFGAERSNSPSSKVTHVIVDSDYCMADVRSDCLDWEFRKSTAIVNDKWLTESIGFKEMRSTDAVRFRVADPERGMLCSKSSARQQCMSRRDSETPERTASPEIEDAAAKVREDKKGALNEANQMQDKIDDFFEEAKALRDLPVNGDEDTSREPSFNEIEEDRTESFQCMLRHDGKKDAGNPNIQTINILQKMASYYERIGDRWRTVGYRKAISALCQQSSLISTKEQALAIPRIGERLADKIEEIVTHNRLRRLESTATDPNDQILQLFMGIYQVGYPTASRWIAQGFRTLQDLMDKADLSSNQRVGIEHYHDFLARIPRAEVAEHAQIVEKALKSIDSKLQLIIGGSYRRGSADSGDIDIIITKEDASLEHIRTLMLGSVIPKLWKQDFLQAALATGKVEGSCSKWHGASVTPGSRIWRRLDLLFVPWNELGAALLYFTGNDIFNRSIRLLASKKGMRLNQHGLYADVMRDSGRPRITEGKLVEGQSEERIFKILGVTWRPPEHRQC